MTASGGAAEQIITALGWHGVAQTVPGAGEVGYDQTRIVHDADARWIGVTAYRHTGSVQLYAGEITKDGAFRDPQAESIPLPVGDTDALALAVTGLWGRLDGKRAEPRQRIDVVGTVWLIFDDGLSRLPLVCRECQERTRGWLTADEALATFTCRDGHVTRDGRLTPDGVRQAIAAAQGSSSVPGDLEIPGALPA